MSNQVRNTKFDNLVNYNSNKSSSEYAQNNLYNSVDPNSISFYSKNNQIVEYKFASFSERLIVSKESDVLL